MTSTDLLLRQYKEAGVLIDTNLLLLSVVGRYDKSLLGLNGFKRLAQFTVEDFHILERMRTYFVRTVVTPHVLAEVSSLIGQIGGWKRAQCYTSFGRDIENLRELETQSAGAAQRSEFRDLGLTDCTILEKSEGYLVLTEDARCAIRLSAAGRDVINFNHLRVHFNL